MRDLHHSLGIHVSEVLAGLEQQGEEKMENEKEHAHARGEAQAVADKERDKLVVTHVAMTPQGPQLGGYIDPYVSAAQCEHAQQERARAENGEQLQRRVPRMWNEDEDGPGVVKTEYDIQKAIEMIGALTRNLLHLPPEHDVDVHVKPQNRQYVVEVDIVGFKLSKKHKRMSVALEEMLSDLGNKVQHRIDEAQKLLKHDE